MFPSVSPAWHWPVNWISDRSKERSSAWRTSLLLSRPSRRPRARPAGMAGTGFTQRNGPTRCPPLSRICLSANRISFPLSLITNIAVLLERYMNFCQQLSRDANQCHRTRTTTSLCSSAWENGLLYLQCKSVQGFSFRTAGFPQYGWKAGISVRHRSSGCARTRLSNQNLELSVAA